jgi:hypothetical protein
MLQNRIFCPYHFQILSDPQRLRRKILSWRLLHIRLGSKMSNRSAQIALVTVGTLLAGAAGYAVYFDYMRRNSPEFRKGLSERHLRY